MTAEELKDIALCGETTTIQFKQEFTGQKKICKEMIAFANTRGGKIIFGIKDKTGELLGLSYDDIQTISRELGNTANEQVRPTIYIDIEVVRADDKHFLVCAVEQGKNKPYKTLTGEIWVKQGTDLSVNENNELPDKVALLGEITDKIHLSGNTDGKIPITDAFIDKITDIYIYICQHPHTSTEEIATFTDRSKESAKKYLQALSAIEMITPEGANKNRTYSIIK